MKTKSIPHSSLVTHVGRHRLDIGAWHCFAVICMILTRDKVGSLPCTSLLGKPVRLLQEVPRLVARSILTWGDVNRMINTLKQATKALSINVYSQKFSYYTLPLSKTCLWRNTPTHMKLSDISISTADITSHNEQKVTTLSIQNERFLPRIMTTSNSPGMTWSR